MDNLPLLIDVFPVSSHLINIKCAEYCKFSLLKLKSLYIPPPPLFYNHIKCFASIFLVFTLPLQRGMIIQCLLVIWLSLRILFFLLSLLYM